MCLTQKQWCRVSAKMERLPLLCSSPLLSSPLLSRPQWNSSRAWQDLSGCLPLPCRCYSLEHSRSAKWGNWSLLDLWLLDPHHHPLLLLCFPFCPPSLSVTQSLLPSLPQFLSLFALTVSRSQATDKAVVLWCDFQVVVSPPKPLQPSCAVTIEFYVPSFPFASFNRIFLIVVSASKNRLGRWMFDNNTG